MRVDWEVPTREKGRREKIKCHYLWAKQLKMLIRFEERSNPLSFVLTVQVGLPSRECMATNPCLHTLPGGIISKGMRLSGKSSVFVPFTDLLQKCACQQYSIWRPLWVISCRCAHTPINVDSVVVFTCFESRVKCFPVELPRTNVVSVMKMNYYYWFLEINFG